MLRSIATSVAHQIFAEDGSIYQGVQKGMAASPHTGVIGTREERIYLFQKYVLDATVGATELPVMAGDGQEAGTGARCEGCGAER